MAEKQTSPVLSFVRLIKLNWLRRSQILQKHEGGTHIGLPSQSNMESGLGWSGQWETQDLLADWNIFKQIHFIPISYASLLKCGRLKCKVIRQQKVQLPLCQKANNFSCQPNSHFPTLLSCRQSLPVFQGKLKIQMFNIWASLKLMYIVTQPCPVGLKGGYFLGWGKKWLKEIFLPAFWYCCFLLL